MHDHTTQHWQTFSTTAKAHIARRFWQYRADFRNRIVQAALNHWPEEITKREKWAIINRIYDDPEFREELSLGPVTWWLLGVAVKVILSALLDYWFLTQSTTHIPKTELTDDHAIPRRSTCRPFDDRAGLPGDPHALGRVGRLCRDR